MTDLSPCPFCGSPAFTTYSTQNEHRIQISSAICSGTGCKARIDRAGSEAGVAAAWNRRQSDATYIKARL